MSFSRFTEEDHEVIREAYSQLKEAAAKRCANQEELDVVQKAFDFANEAHKNVRRRSGGPYIIHPIEVAKIVVCDIGLGYKSIAAALLHDVVEDTAYTVEDLRNLFGDKIASLVDGLTKIKNVLDNEDRSKKLEGVYSESLQAENFKRILLTLNDDVRVVLIKLADRLHNCRTIDSMPEYKRDKILSETMFIFIPLAHRLGLYEIKSEMENIWLKYKEPDAYNEISRLVSKNVNDLERQIDEFIVPIDAALREAGFDFKIKKRVKTPYSIWHKMRTKNISFEQVYDLYALRIIFTPDSNSKKIERSQCYSIFTIISDIYRNKDDRVRDWVKHPKSNGYEALHCTLMSPRGVWIEVQIRSKRMDDIAEKGIAAHWAYKREGYLSENDSEMDKWLAKVNDILVSNDVNALELLDIIHNDLTSGEITVFTPKGEQKTLQKGSTALDFAYGIHTEIGNKAIAAKVNMKLETLSHVLKTGDQVEIITAENERPKQEWLKFLQSRHARNVVIDYFKGNKPHFVKIGKEMVQTQLESIGYRLNSDSEDILCKKLNVAGNPDELYFRVGLGLVPVNTLGEFLTPVAPPARSSLYWPFSLFSRRKDPQSQQEGKLKDKFVIANCCNPIRGDAVIGITNPDGTITVHKKTCPVAESIASKHGDRVVTPLWEDESDLNAFPVRISITGIDRLGLLNEISRYISLVMGVNMKKVLLSTDGGIFEGYIDLSVHDRTALDRMIRKLGSIEGIQNVARIEL
ncbi:MAG: bifunctional (p)ppGpp synthetase/guanosine-3',5'-bis(diphosphate) 3'-pyrophosphohydrolase [Bacteroidales bacterium]|nr:bifunctional (p)ppGpp synthetase/guanosine-3',5'-bis(diphosphate) 3'-pyrophosphohydrolase [Bacteroidales bacterium]